MRKEDIAVDKQRDNAGYFRLLAIDLTVFPW